MKSAIQKSAGQTPAQKRRTDKSRLSHDSKPKSRKSISQLPGSVSVRNDGDCRSTTDDCSSNKKATLAMGGLLF
jgi:hypothetical protein